MPKQFDWVHFFLYLLMVAKFFLTVFIFVITVSSSSGKTVEGFQISNSSIDLSGPWTLLENFYRKNMPLLITVEFKEFTDGYSKFNCSTNTVLINPKITDQKKLQSIIVHEASHLALCIMTQQFNIQKEARFWDEGLATIFQYRQMGKEFEYRKKANMLAREQMNFGNLNFSKLKNWYSYSRDGEGKINNFAYGVGSSFIYFLIDKFGEESLREFLKDLGQTKDFGSSVKSSFSLSEEQVLAQWCSYLQIYSEK